MGETKLRLVSRTARDSSVNKDYKMKNLIGKNDYLLAA